MSTQPQWPPRRDLQLPMPMNMTRYELRCLELASDRPWLLGMWSCFKEVAVYLEGRNQAPDFVGGLIYHLEKSSCVKNHKQKIHLKTKLCRCHRIFMCVCVCVLCWCELARQRENIPKPLEAKEAKHTPQNEPGLCLIEAKRRSHAIVLHAWWFRRSD